MIVGRFDRMATVSAHDHETGVWLLRIAGVA
jgi:hypothetical protein